MKHVRVSRGLDEVQACMDAVVYNLLPVDTVLLLQVRVKTRLDVLHNRSPTALCLVRDSFFSLTKYIPLIIISKVTKARGINNRQM